MDPADRPSSKRSGTAAAVVYICVLAVLTYFAGTRGVAQFYVATAYLEAPAAARADAAKAIGIDPANADALDAEGLSHLKTGDYDRAAGAYKSAVRLREKDYYLWLQLGYSQAQLGNLDAAKAAYERSLELAPTYTRPNYYMGQLLLQLGDKEQAFRLLGKAARYDPSLYPDVLETARSAFGDDALAIEKAMDPHELWERVLLARFLLSHGHVTERTRQLLSGDELTVAAREDFVRYLIEKRDFSTAHDVWLSLPDAPGRGAGDLVDDGGFESIAAGGGSAFGWVLNDDVSNVSIERDTQKKRTGSSSLRVAFSGAVEPNAPIVSQLVYLKPHGKYRLTFAYSSAEMVSAGLPTVVVSDGGSNQFLGSTGELISTGGKWVTASVDFETRENAAATIDLRRGACKSPPCPIFGDLSLDDVSLTER